MRMATKPYARGLEPVSETLPPARPLLLPFLCVFREILGRDFGTHQALPEELGAGVCGML